MKKWKCTVCGYIHEGETPPEECPLCKASSDKFEEVVEEAAEEATEVTKEEVVEESVSEGAEEAAEKVTEEKSSRRWKCIICGYIHEGDGPPEECPICKAGPEKFIEIDSDGNEIVAKKKPAKKGAKDSAPEKKGPGFIARMMMKFHVHPISVHFPNGILPIGVIFLAVSVFLGTKGFETAAFYNFVGVLVTLPLVLLTGYIEWKNRYMGAKTFVFFTKIACSVIVTLTLITLVAWRYFEPGVAEADSPFRLIYFGVAVVMLVATGIAGHLGGKLVFGTRGK